jgi:hypothetical protein
LISIIICVERPNSASFSSESQFSGRGAAEADRREQKALFGKAKDIIEKITNLF